MYKVFLVCIMILVGCNVDEDVASYSKSLSFSEVGKEDLSKDILKFRDNVQKENGVHLYYDGQKVIYVYLNGSQVEQGEEAAVHYSDFNVQEDGDTLNIFYNETKTTDYSSHSLNYNLMYKVDLNKKYEYIRGFRNGEEAPFNIVSGNGN